MAYFSNKLETPVLRKCLSKPNKSYECSDVFLRHLFQQNTQLCIICLLHNVRFCNSICKNAAFVKVKLKKKENKVRNARWFLNFFIFIFHIHCLHKYVTTYRPITLISFYTVNTLYYVQKSQGWLRICSRFVGNIE